MHSPTINIRTDKFGLYHNLGHWPMILFGLVTTLLFCFDWFKKKNLLNLSATESVPDPGRWASVCGVLVRPRDVAARGGRLQHRTRRVSTRSAMRRRVPGRSSSTLDSSGKYSFGHETSRPGEVVLNTGLVGYVRRLRHYTRMLLWFFSLEFCFFLWIFWFCFTKKISVRIYWQNWTY